MIRTLVVILCETRASKSTFDSFKKNLMEPFQADLALCVANNSREDKGNPFYQTAKYVWQTEEYDDWGDGLEHLVEDAHPNWRELLAIKDQWLGGVKGKGEQPGSGAIILYFRAFLKQCLLEEGIIEKYDRIIVTRSDFLYEVPHLPPKYLSNQFIWIPDGEQYGGYTDRHILFPTKYALQVMSVAEIITRPPEETKVEMSNSKEWNVEKVLKSEYNRNGVSEHIRMFPYTMYTVREPDGHTSWREGTLDSKRNLYIKYRFEYLRSNIAQFLLGKNGWNRLNLFLFCIANGIINWMASVVRFLRKMIR
jgi:hypothetical protein